MPAHLKQYCGLYSHLKFIPFFLKKTTIQNKLGHLLSLLIEGCLQNLCIRFSSIFTQSSDSITKLCILVLLLLSALLFSTLMNKSQFPFVFYRRKFVFSMPAKFVDTLSTDFRIGSLYFLIFNHWIFSFVVFGHFRYIQYNSIIYAAASNQEMK